MSAYTALLSWSIKSVYTAIDHQDVSGAVDAVSKCRHDEVRVSLSFLILCITVETSEKGVVESWEISSYIANFTKRWKI